MSALVQQHTKLAPSSPEAIDKVRRLTEALKALPQVAFSTEHLLHAGMYTRTIRLPAETALTAVLIKIPTVLIAVGTMDIYSNEEVYRIEGYNVFLGSAGRKLAIITYSVVAMSMLFPTSAKTVDEAQREFTDEHELLVPLSDVQRHHIVITGE